MAKKGKDEDDPPEPPVDLAARIGARPAAEPPPPPPSPPPADVLPPRLDGPLPPRRPDPRVERPPLIGMDEPPPPPVPDPPAEEEARSEAIPSPRTAPGPGETDLVVTPIPTLDDWHRFELALRKVRGVGQVRTEYYRHGVLKVRVSYAGSERLANALRGGIPGYRVRVLGEDRTTLQILVSSQNDERRPG